MRKPNQRREADARAGVDSSGSSNTIGSSSAIGSSITIGSSSAIGSSNTRRKIGVVGPYPPFRGGIAHFTEQFHLNLVRTESQAELSSAVHVVGISFHRQYPTWLFPGKSQFATDSAEHVKADRLLDSINPLSWDRVATHLIQEGVDEVVFMYWMPFFAPAYLRIIQLLKRADIRVTAIVHNASPHEKQPFGLTLSKAFLSRCDRVIALSSTVKRDIITIGVKGEIQVAAHPVYNQFGNAVDPSAAREKLGIDPTRPVILFFGLVRKYKGLDILLSALPKVKAPTTLLVAGEWYEGRSELKKLIQEEGISDRVIIRDEYIPDDEVHLYFSAADVLIQPYRSATQSGVVQTAFHFGLPSIVTGVGGLPEMVEHDVNGWVVAPEDPDALARAIDHFYEPDCKERLTKGAQKAQDGNSWGEFVAKFLS